jgi:hypothetical protein
MRIDEEQLAETLKQPGYSIQGDPASAPLIGTTNIVTRVAGINKYRAQRTEYNGRVYPSKHHAEVRQQLDTAVKGGAYDNIIEEVPFRLPGKTNTGRPFIHRVDFGCLKDGKVIRWIEVKGKDLELGKLKRRQVEELYKIRIEIL